METYPLFHRQTVIRDWGDGAAFRIADALTGVCVFGATGSGKTSGPAKHLAYGYLAKGFGGVVLCAKPEEARQWQAWAAETGRTKDLVIIDAQGTWRFNPLEWEASRGGGGGFTINIVSLLDEIAGSISGSGEAKGGGDQLFWENARRNLITNLVDLAVLAGLEVSLPLLRKIASSAPTSLEQLSNPEWVSASQCIRALADADELTRKADSETRADFEECQTFWTQDFPSLAEETRSSIMLNFVVMIRNLVTRPLRKLFSSDTNVKPEDTFSGRIIIVNLPVQEYGMAGKIANLLWKSCFQKAVLRRMPPTIPGQFLRPVFLWADEAQHFITKQDSEYQATARSAGGCTVYLTQNRESYRRVLGNNDAVDSLLGNLQCKLFCQNAGDTNEYAAKLLGERWLKVSNTSFGQNQSADVTNRQQGGSNAGVSTSEQRRYYVEPSRFTTLMRGGENNDFIVEAIVYNGGHLFPSTSGSEKFLPYRLLAFNQK